MTPKPSREGLIWEDNGLFFKVYWETEPAIPAIESICQKALSLESSDDCTITYLTSGALNKIYLVNVNGTRKYIFRVTLPVDPHHKTAGEVATLKLLRKSTTIPVPEIFAFDDSSNNELGYEWILMELMPGVSAYESWRKMSMAAKTTLVKQLAEYQVQLFKLEQNGRGFHGIGTIREKKDNKRIRYDDLSCLGPVVQSEFFMADRYSYPFPRGPFRSSFAWLDTFINITLQEQIEEVNKAKNEGDRINAVYNQKATERLALLLPKIFPSIQNPPERTILWHDDLSLNNILVNEEGAITAILDWEYAGTKPFWVATGLPEALVNESREECPLRDTYGNESPQEREERAAQGDSRDNEGKNSLYWTHLMEYEQTQLRTIYRRYMREIWPAWEAEVTGGTLKLDFLDAVMKCSNHWAASLVELWIEEIEYGNFVRLDRDEDEDEDEDEYEYGDDDEDDDDDGNEDDDGDEDDDEDME